MISIIIPCYNDGRFLDDCLMNLDPKSELYEVIIINDGSTEPATIEKLNDLHQKFHYKVINQDNKGLSAARNTGIRNAQGKYILPLDSDNKIRLEYISKSIEILEQDEIVGVVYSDVQFFGDRTDIKKTGDYKFHKELANNSVDACAVFRKKIWEDIGGYDENMRLGYEDWDFWLRIYSEGWEFHYLKEPLFYYRVRGNSMVSNTRKHHKEVLNYIHRKHLDELSKTYMFLYSDYEYLIHFYKKVEKNPFIKMYRKIVAKNRMPFKPFLEI